MLCLLVQGLTYAQITDKLVVSRRTVNVHATSIDHRALVNPSVVRDQRHPQRTGNGDRDLVVASVKGNLNSQHRHALFERIAPRFSTAILDHDAGALLAA